MADPEAQDRPPAKRFKHLHQGDPFNGRHDPAAAHFPTAAAAAGLSFHPQFSGATTLMAPENALFDSSWSWQTPSPLLPQAQQPQQQRQGLLLREVQEPSQPSHSILEIPAEEPLHHDHVWDLLSPEESSAGPLASVVPFYTDPVIQASRLPRLLPAASDNSPDPTPTLTQDQRRRKNRAKVNLSSPFKDCVEAFTSLRFSRPRDGSVNGYVKFHWTKKSSPSRSQAASIVHSPSEKPSSPIQSSRSLPPTATELSVVHNDWNTGFSQSDSGDLQLSPASSMTLQTSPPSARSSFSIYSAHQLQQLSPQGILVPIQNAADFMNQYGSNLDGYDEEALSVELVSAGAVPQYLPPMFGYHAKMDSIDRRFFCFYVYNWCPGRTILRDSNLWLVDFAKMHANDGVRAAIQSLAGIYIYDYMPTEPIRKRISDRFAEAEARFSHLLNDSANITAQNADEVITLSVLLSMQDIILTESRLRKPYIPRWLQGFKHGEHFLQLTDQGERFWNRSNIQMSSLHNAHCIMIGRGIIVSATMMALPAAASFDPIQEVSRFGWLLYGDEAGMYEIHGGCGFSKKLLHLISQITYCAARLQQERESPFVPTTANHILRQLSELRQWSKISPESDPDDHPEGPAAFDWDTAKTGQSIIAWVRSLPEGFIVSKSKDMTDVTAEAWRIAAIIYLQFRLLRLSRNDPAVMQYIEDLARCIEVMPTSGNHFTAQAPLFPVFLLGIAATSPRHKHVAKSWFEKVVEIPVRSSVPPLYRALKRIWSWLDAETESLSLNPSQSPTSPIYKRRPWWERLVARIREKEQETLCLT